MGDSGNSSVGHAYRSALFVGTHSTIFVRASGRNTIRWSFISSVIAAFLCAPGVVYAQVYEIHHNFIDSEFDRLLLKNQFIPKKEYVVPALKPYFSNFCNSQELKELIDSKFDCNNRICKTTRYKYLLGQFTPNIVRKSWNLTVDLSGNGCPNVIIEFGHEFNPGYQYGN